MIWRWLLLIPAVLLVLPLLGIVVLVLAIYPPFITGSAVVILAMLGFWFFSLRRRVSGGPDVDGEASLLPSTKAKAGLL